MEIHIKQGMYWSVDKNVTRGSWDPSPIFPLGAMVQESLNKCVQQLYRTQLPRMRVDYIFRKSEELKWPRAEYQLPSRMSWDPCRVQAGKMGGSPGERVTMYIGIDQINKHIKDNGSQVSLRLCPGKDSVAMSTPNPQVLASKYNFPWLMDETEDSSTRTGKIQYKPETSLFFHRLPFLEQF